jgi:predicted short-subunit dehydrogenase-like oxidoreductase (DUF2520 family)
LDIILAGPGRAGTAVCLAAKRAGHRVVAVAGRTTERVEAAADRLGALALRLDDELPGADLLIIGVRDDAIQSVATGLAVHSSRVDAAVHLSGLTPVDALEPLEDAGHATGVLHPLQTLPTAEAGAEALAGCWIAVTASDDRLAADLDEFATSLGSHPFALPDEARAVYHAAAAAAANGTIAVLDLAAALFGSAGVPFEASRPLVEAVVDNAFHLGPHAALTGPIARGDVGTVAAQVHAVAENVPEQLGRFVALCRLIADVAGTADMFEDVL